MASINKVDAGYRVRYRDPEGNQRSRTVKKRQEAIALKTSIEHSKLSGHYVDLRAGKIRFREYAEQWRVQQAHRTGTFSQIETNFRRHVYPEIGEKQLSGIRKSTVQALVAKLAEELAPSTVQLIYGYVGAVFKAAMDDRLLATSPCTKIALPKQPKKRIVPLRTDVVQTIADVVAPRYKALIVTGAGTGLRVSECLGLTVDRVDFLRRTITIDRQLISVQNGLPVFGPPKTDMSDRTVPLPSVVQSRLAAHLAEFGTGPNGIVFTNETGLPFRRNRVSEFMRKARSELSLEMDATFHDLRHYYASLLIHRGLSVKAVQLRLGHSSAVETLDTYSHLWPDSEDDTRDAVDTALGEALAAASAV